MARASVDAPTPDLILHAANRCFRRFGLRRTTVEDVAREAGVSRGSVYRYFRDRQALIEAAMVRNAQAFFAHAARRLSRLPTLEAKLAEAAVLARRYGEADPVYAGLAETEPESLAVLLTTHAERFMRMSIEFLRPLLAEAKRRGEVRADLDTERAAEWVVRMLLSLVHTPSVTVDVTDPSELRRFVADHLVRGLR